MKSGGLAITAALFGLAALGLPLVISINVILNEVGVVVSSSVSNAILLLYILGIAYIIYNGNGKSTYKNRISRNRKGER